MVDKSDYCRPALPYRRRRLVHQGRIVPLNSYHTPGRPVFIGKVHQDNALLRYGLWLYNEAIHDMSKALRMNTYSDDIVCTCTLFGRIEIRAPHE